MVAKMVPLGKTCKKCMLENQVELLLFCNSTKRKILVAKMGPLGKTIHKTPYNIRITVPELQVAAGYVSTTHHQFSQDLHMVIVFTNASRGGRHCHSLSE